MSQTQHLRTGQYAYSSHSLMVSGDIADVFIGKWEESSAGNRVLTKYPPSSEIEGEPMCIIKLRKPIPLEEYRGVHHPAVRPMVSTAKERHIGPESEVVMVMLPTAMVCTFPDFM